MIISRTPFRVSFFGGGTDFPEFYKEHGGATLLTAINKYCYISAHRFGPFFKHKYRASYAQTELVNHPSEFKHPLIRECMLMLGVNVSLELTHIADLPGRTGLGSSSSFAVGLLHTLHALQGKAPTAEQLSRESITVERDRVGDSGGHQDQYAAAYGGFRRFQFSGKGVEAQHIDLQPSRKAELESCLMMFYMGIEQSAENILQEQKKRVQHNVPALLEMLKMVDEAQAILQGRGSLDDFGRLLNDSWQRKKSLSKGISNTDIDLAYQAARDAGALGGKLLGAGGRGFLLLYADPAQQPAVREKLKDLREVPFGFSEEGSRIIFQAPE